MPDENDSRVGISADLTEDVSEGMRLIGDALDDTGDKATRMGAKLRAAGKAAGEGMDEVAGSTNRARDAQGRFLPMGERTDTTLGKQNWSARRAARGLDRYSRALAKARRRAGSLALTMMATKWSLYAAGGMAVVGMLSALGAAGAIAVGGLAPIIGVLAAFGPLMFAAVAGMIAWKLAGAAATDVVKPLGEAFKAYGDDIAAVMIPGLRDMVRMMRSEFVPVVGGGLIEIGQVLGDVARMFGQWSTQSRNLNRFGTIFSGLDPIIRDMVAGLLGFLSALLDITAGALPMVRELADDFRWLGEGLAWWTNGMYESGRMSRWLLKSYDLLKRTIGVLVDFIIGIYHVFRIAAGSADEMGNSIEDLAYKFRLWTESAEGQQRIAQYFQDTLPAIRETGLLLGAIVAGLAGMAAHQDVAPLLSQIRTELLPALGALLAHFVGDGSIGPAAITALTALANAIAAVPVGPVTQLVIGIGQLIGGIGWLITNVPGLGTALSYLAAATLVYKLGLFATVAAVKMLGTVISLVSNVVTVLGKILPYVAKALMLVGRAFLFVGRAIMMAFMANPVVAAIIIIIGIILLLWFKCAWFRDAVIAVWEWIKKAALVTWEWIKKAWDVTVDALVRSGEWVREKVSAVWNWILAAARSTWAWLVKAWHATIDPIVAAARWMWDRVLAPIFGAIARVARVTFSIIKFAVQTAVFFAVVWFTVMYTVWRGIVKGIIAAAKWIWENGIKPVIDWIVGGWTWLIETVMATWDRATADVARLWNWVWQTVIAPGIDAFRAGWQALTDAVSAAWGWTTEKIAAGWNWVWQTLIAPGIDAFRWAWQGLVDAIAIAWGWVTGHVSAGWQAIQWAAGAATDYVREKWNALVSWVRDVWQPVGDGIASLWDKIKTAGVEAGDRVKAVWNGVIDVVKRSYNTMANAWNNIPSFEVPEYVPGIGGQSFSLPKLPTLWHGGATPGGPALVGEHGPEPLVRGGRVVGMLGASGPEITNLPRGGYVVPNLSTLNALPGLTKRIPGSVAAAVAAAVPGYDLGAMEARVPARTSAGEHSGGGDPAVGDLADAVGRVAAAVGSQPPPLAVRSDSDDRIERAVLRALRKDRRERAFQARYDYSAGGGS